MKAINYLFIYLLYSSINFSFADSPIGVWESPENSDSQTFSISIKQKDNQFVGSYCAVAMSGNRIDCDPENTFEFSNAGSEFIFKSNYSDKSGKAIITLSDYSLVWKVTEPPKGEYYAPLNANLNKATSKIKPASEIACLVQLYEFGRNYSPSLMGEDSTTESVTEKNKFVENELITVSTTKNDNSWMRTRECDSCNPKKFITELFLRDSPKAIPCDMKFGSDIYHVKSKLGKANNITDAGYHAYYYPLIEQNQSISLHFSDDHLDAIYWQFYWD